MRTMKCKYCGNEPEFFVRGTLRWAICRDCGFSVVRIQESDDIEKEEMLLTRDWCIHQFLPESKDKRY